MATGQITVAVAVDGEGSIAALRQAASHSLYLATLFLCSRLYHRAEAPLGVQGGFDLGAVYVRSRDPDFTTLLRGKRVGKAPALDQRWPTVAEVRARSHIGTDVVDAQIQDAIDAAVEIVTETVSSIGVA